MEGWQPAAADFRGRSWVGRATCSARGLQRSQQASHYSQAVLCRPSCPRAASCFGVRTEFEVPGIVHAGPRPSMSRMEGARNKCTRHANFALGRLPCSLWGCAQSAAAPKLFALSTRSETRGRMVVSTIQHRKRSPHCLFDPSPRQGDWISHDITGSGQHGFARVANARHAVAGGTDPLRPI